MKKITTVLFCVCFLPVLYGSTRFEELKYKVCEALPKIEGWCSKEKALNFMDLVLKVHPQVCVEIGVFGGASLFPVASTLKFLGSGTVIAIDPWDKLECIKHFDPVVDAEHLQWWGSLDLERIYISYLNMLKRYKLANYCLTLRTTSEEAASEVDEIDILHIDGDHSEEVTLKDVALYLPKVRSGGYIWLNDSLSVKRQDAIDRLSEKCDVVKLIDNGNCILFKKR